MRTIACLLFAAVLAAAEAARPVPEATAVPDARAFAFAIIPDLMRSAGRLEAIGARIAPSHVPPGAWTKPLAALLGKVGPGPALVAVQAGTPLPAWAVVLPLPDAAALSAAAEKQGLGLVEAVGPLAVWAKQVDGLELGKRLAGRYAELAKLAPPAGTDIRILFAADRCAATYLPLLSGMMAMAAGQGRNVPPEAAMGMRVAGLAFAGVGEVARDCAAVQVDATWDADVIRLVQLVAAKPGSALAKALVAPAPAREPGLAARFDRQPAWMAYAGRMPSSAFFDYLLDLHARLLKRPEARGLLTPEQTADLAACRGLLGDEFAGRARSTKSQPMVQDFAYALAGDPARVLGTLGSFMQALTRGAMGELMTAGGMAVTWEPAVRTSGGATVARLAFSATAPAGQAVRQAPTPMPPTEMAALPGVLLSSNDSLTLDVLVQGRGPGLELRAPQRLGPGRDVYYDWSLVGQLKAMGAGMPPMVGTLFSELPDGGEPMAMASTFDAGRARVETLIPVQPIVDIATTLISGMRGEPAPASNRETF